MKRLALAALALIPLACRTTADGGDTTPPALTLNYRWGDLLWTEVRGDVSLLVPPTETLYLWANAHDVGGVERAVVSAEGNRRCSTGSGGGGPGSPGGGVSSTPLEFSEDAVAPESEGVGESTAATRNVVMRIDFATLCDAGSSKDTVLHIDASASNFGGRSRTVGTLTVTAKVPDPGE